MGLYRVEAIILRGKDYGEADRILTLYSREEGKLNVIAKGVKKLKSRMRGSVQLFSHSGFILYAGRGSLDTVTQADLREPFAALQGDLSRWAHANYIAETLELVPERQAQEELFILLVTILHLLAFHEPLVVTILWQIRLLRMLGYAPQLDNCAFCGALAGGECFSPGHGGVLCKTCGARGGGQAIHPGTIAVWRYLERIPLEKLDRLKIGRLEMLELKRVLRSYYEYLLEKPLKSGDFLDESESIIF